MPNDDNKTKDKKRNNYSFSIKKTDSPIIKQFVEEQTNFSESVRYLILKFCRENGVKDISNMLSEFMFFQSTESPILKKENHEKITREVIEKSPIIEAVINKKVEELVESDIDNFNTEIIKENKSEHKEEIDDDIPDCYS